MLLTKRAEPSSAAAAAHLAAVDGSDAGAAATVPGGPGRWLLPPADEGARHRPCALEVVASSAAWLARGQAPPQPLYPLVFTPFTPCPSFRL